MQRSQLKASFEQLFAHGVDASDQCISFGSIDFAGNPSFSRWLLDIHVKDKPQIPDFDQFITCRKPKEPDFSTPKENGPAFAPTPEQLARFDGPDWAGKSPQIHTVITQQNYLNAQKEYEQKYRRHAKMAERSRCLAQAHHGDFAGYRSFLCDPAYADDGAAFPVSLPAPDRAFFISNPEFYLSEQDRQRHTYITAESGHGKSVTIERLIYHYARADSTQSPCIILIDPHGDLAEDVARFIGIDERLAYIKPALSTRLTPTINPFDITSKDWKTIALATDAFIEVFREIMRADKDGNQFSPQMVTILKPCIATLLHMDKTSVADLIPFLSEEKAETQTYLNHALQHLTNQTQIEFLRRDFFKPAYNPSKLSIKTKIRNLLADDYFHHFLCGPTTLDLDAAIQARKIILFDLSEQTVAAGSAIGRFVMASVTKFAFAQGELPPAKRIPVHLFVDECQDYISDSMKQIVTKTRKFRLYGTFAQQFCGQGMDTELKRAIIGNSRIKITGGNELSSLKTISAETGAPVEELQSLRTGHFHVKAGKSPSVAVKIPMVPAKEKLGKPAWEQRKAQQIKRYYRPIDFVREEVTTPEASPQQSPQTKTPPARGAKRRVPAYNLKP